jgi:hypothetical protein
MRRLHTGCFVRCAMTACSSDTDTARTHRVLADPCISLLEHQTHPAHVCSDTVQLKSDFFDKKFIVSFQPSGSQCCTHAAPACVRRGASSATQPFWELRLLLGAAHRLPLTHAHGRTVEDKENSSASATQHSSTRISGHSTQLAGGGGGVSAIASRSKSVMSRVSNADAPRASTISQGQEASSQMRQSYEQVWCE